jgi:class 3 adenylate cyclase
MLLAREQRKLAAIVAADVVGYSRLMGRDESGTLARLRKNRSEHLDPVVAKYGGRLVKLTGDGALVEFASAVDALSASIEFQQGMAEANGDQPADTALVFRIGINLGDIIVEGDDIFGDGVNVAARLQEIAAPEAFAYRAVCIRMCATVSTPRSTTVAHKHSRTLPDLSRSGAGNPPRLGRRVRPVTDLTHRESGDRDVLWRVVARPHLPFYTLNEMLVRKRLFGHRDDHGIGCP